MFDCEIDYNVAQGFSVEKLFVDEGYGFGEISAVEGSWCCCFFEFGGGYGSQVGEVVVICGYVNFDISEHGMREIGVVVSSV